MQSHFFDFVLHPELRQALLFDSHSFGCLPAIEYLLFLARCEDIPLPSSTPLPLNSLTPSSSSSSPYLLWMTQVKDVNGLTVKSSLQTPSCFISISATTTLVVRVPTTSVSHVSGKIAELPAQNGTTSLHISEVRRLFFFFRS